ncbi:MAG TPA: glycine cleavage system protein GcvH [Ignavibacteria bacterium]|nr:glycine cleavage system protein GcvH [Ignavibacteria bacterium]HRE11645.1 glycine cleavage system protein GcvH [Ignavibacteria bacterium]HRF66675.1 glycine cleavage system protein GcvH [Ignavibacteria bacterium]HRJ05510.1 glycine cleavage system protein GcvH [Ignavibacteria bacterium]HRJ85854.1 glycine cleavage system protein GcvH [Ignavibacteria bacterium]
MNIPADLKYTKDHEWVKVEGNTGTVGVTDYAQGELGDIIYVDVTTVGNDVAMGDTFGTIEAVKTVSDMYAPVSGKIAEFNSAVNDNPASVNQDPYGAGWLVKIDISNMGDLDSLLSPEDYKNLVGG